VSVDATFWPGDEEAPPREPAARALMAPRCGRPAAPPGRGVQATHVRTGISGVPADAWAAHGPGSLRRGRVLRPNSPPSRAHSAARGTGLGPGLGGSEPRSGAAEAAQEALRPNRLRGRSLPRPLCRMVLCPAADRLVGPRWITVGSCQLSQRARPSPDLPSCHQPTSDSRLPLVRGHAGIGMACAHVPHYDPAAAGVPRVCRHRAAAGSQGSADRQQPSPSRGIIPPPAVRSAWAAQAKGDDGPPRSS